MSLFFSLVVGFFALLGIFVVLLIILSVIQVIESRNARKRIWEWVDREDKRYSSDPSLLRGQDYLAAIWYDRIRGNESPDPVLEYKLVAVATFLEREAGRFYFDGRPVQQGWMTEKDVEDYIDYVLKHGDSKFRYEVFLKGRRFGHKNGRVHRLERAMDQWLAHKNKVMVTKAKGGEVNSFNKHSAFPTTSTSQAPR